MLSRMSVHESTTLVLGGSGFLGAHVVAAALAHERKCAGRGETAAVVHSASREPDAFARDERAVPCVLDALRANAAEELCERLQPTRIVLCTALGKISECESYPGLARALNVEFPARIARWCSLEGARLVFVSSDLVFGGQPPLASGFREEDPPAPLSEYGRTKASAEESVIAIDPAALVVRLPLLYGPSGGRGTGASDSLLRAVERGERPVLFTDEWRTPLPVADAARALIELAYGAVRGRLHVAGPERITRYHLALAVLTARGFDRGAARAMIVEGTRRSAGLEALRPSDVALDARRAREILPCALHDVRSGLARAYPRA